MTNTRALDAMLGKLAQSVDGTIKKRLGPLEQRLAALEEKVGPDAVKAFSFVADIETQLAVLAKRPEPPTIDEIMVDCSARIASAVEQAVAEIPIPKDGRDGKDGASVDAYDILTICAEPIAKAVSDEVAKIPPPKDGKDGAEGAEGKPGPKGDTGQKGDQGTQGNQGIPGEPGGKGDVGPSGKDGKDADLVIVSEDLASDCARAVQLLHESPPIQLRRNGIFIPEPPWFEDGVVTTQS